MFENSDLSTSGGRRQWKGTAAAILAQAALVGTLIALPLLYVETLPPLSLPDPLVFLSRPLTPPPPAAAAGGHRSVAKQTQTQAQTQAPVAPRKFQVSPAISAPPIPADAPLLADAAPALSDNSAANGVIGGIPGGQSDGVIGGIPGATAPAAPPPPATPSAPQRIQVGGNVEAARLMHSVQPKYPVVAREARIDGTVELKALISPAGAVEQLNVVSGHPLLVPAALTAVKQWTYEPAYLNGKPVEVATVIDVHFTLS